MRFFTTKQAAEMDGSSPITARKWALANVPNFLEEGQKRTYIWTEEDIERYKARNKAQGFPKGKARK